MVGGEKGFRDSSFVLHECVWGPDMDAGVTWYHKAPNGLKKKEGVVVYERAAEEKEQLLIIWRGYEGN